jgi:cytoskeletal protein RodZ
MLTDFSVKKIETPVLGSEITRLRLGLGLSIVEVSTASGVPKRVLSILESGDHAKLPPEVYVRGYIKNLAPVLHVGAETLLAAYARESAISDTMSPKKSYSASQKSLQGSTITLTPRAVLLTVAVFLVLGVMGYFVWGFYRFVSTPLLLITSPATLVTSTTTESAEVRGQTDKGSTVLLNGVPLPVDKDGYFTTTIPLSQGVNTLRIEATNRFEKTTSTALQIERPVEPVVIPEETPVPLPALPEDPMNPREDGTAATPLRDTLVAPENAKEQ